MDVRVVAEYCVTKKVFQLFLGKQTPVSITLYVLLSVRNALRDFRQKEKKSISFEDFQKRWFTSNR